MADESNPSWLGRNAKIILTVLAFAGWAVSAILAMQSGQPIPPPPPIVVQADQDTPPVAAGPDTHYARGWVRDDDAVATVRATLVTPVFSETPAGAVEEIPNQVYLWDTAKAELGAHIPTRDQGQVGSCVSFGSACAVEYGMVSARVAAKKASRPPPEWKAVSQEVIYGGSRVQIGGGRIRGDGSVGAWAAQWCQKYGSVARGVYGTIDLTAYSESRCRSYGSAGCPKQLEPEAKLHPTKTISQVKTVAELKRALASGYPVTVASDVGFGNCGPYIRNELGQLRASGTWAHQMCFIGYDKAAGILCMNSWGPSWVSGPAGPGNPPPGSFYVAESTAQRMLDQGDSWAYGDQVGFPARRPDWFVRNAQPSRRPFDPFVRGEFALAP